MYERRKDDPLQGFDRAARRRIRGAVRWGVAVRDPQEAPAAAAYAEVVAARSNPIPLGVPVFVALFAAAGLAVLFGYLRVFFLLPFAVAILVRPIQQRTLRKARAAAAANRELARDVGVHEPATKQRTPAWNELTPWGIAACIAVLFAFHFGVRSLIGGDAPPPLPEPAAEPAPVENVAWYGFADRQCREASAAIERLRRNARFPSERHAIRSRTLSRMWEGAGLYPDRANGPMVHLNRALQHEERALELERAKQSAAVEWRKARDEADISTKLLEALGVSACRQAFGASA